MVARSGAVALVVCAALAGALTGCRGAPDVVPPSAGSPCAGRAALDHPDLRLGAAVWARFCPGGGRHADPAAGVALVPDGVLTRGVDAVVRPWQRAVGHHVEFGCGAGESPPAFRVQIGFADGTVGELDADTGTCPTPTNGLQVRDPYGVYASLVTALGRAAAPASQRTTTGPPPCPTDAFVAPVARVTPGSWTGGVLLAQVATLGQICHYVGGRLVATTALTGAQAEALRVAVDGSVEHTGVVPVGSGGATDDAVMLLDASADGVTLWVLRGELYAVRSEALVDLGAVGPYLVSALSRHPQH